MKQRVAWLALVVFGLASAGTAEIASTRLSLNVRPAAQLSLTGPGQVQVKIRLNREAAGQVWTADTCGTVPSGAQTISKSGIHNLQVEGAGSRVCLASTDGTLSTSLTR